MKVLFVEAKAKKNVIGALKINIANIREKKIGLISTIQFYEQLTNVKRYLQSEGKIAVIGKPSGTAVKDGQVLGCDVSAATSIDNKVDCFLYIGTGQFHPLGLLLKTDKPLYVLNPFTEELKELATDEKRKLIKRKILKIEQFKGCKTVGIIVSTKPGQCQLQADPEKIKDKLEKQGKKVYLFICDMITDTELQNFPQIEGWVNTACPRLADDTFSKPLVNAIDL